MILLDLFFKTVIVGKDLCLDYLSIYNFNIVLSISRFLYIFHYKF